MQLLQLAGLSLPEHPHMDFLAFDKKRKTSIFSFDRSRYFYDILFPLTARRLAPDTVQVISVISF